MPDFTLSVLFIYLLLLLFFVNQRRRKIIVHSIPCGLCLNVIKMTSIKYIFNDFPLRLTKKKKGRINNLFLALFIIPFYNEIYSKRFRYMTRKKNFFLRTKHEEVYKIKRLMTYIILLVYL